MSYLTSHKGDAEPTGIRVQPASRLPPYRHRAGGQARREEEGTSP